MAVGTCRLSLLTFPQSWSGNSFIVRFLCLPKGNPEEPLAPGAPSFAAANLVFSARLIPSLDRLPRMADSVAMGPLVLDDPPVQKAALFSELTNHFRIVPRGMPRPMPSFRKAITKSYLALIGDRQRSRYLGDSAEYECVLHEAATGPPPPPAPPPDTVTWGRLISFALRQPNLATALGLVGQVTVTPADSAFFAKGGWLFIDLHGTSDYEAVPNLTARYAARVPPLAEARSVFTAVLFPVVADDASAAPLDDVFREAELYDRGLARLVHGAQSDEGDSIQLTWDDEQIAEWLNRQVERDGVGDLLKDAPTGVAGYRIDVRRQGDLEWNSLVQVASRGNVVLGPYSLGPFHGESIVEVASAAVSPKRSEQFWLPAYFATWRGSSLVLTDEDYKRLHQHPDLQNPEAQPYLLNRDQLFIPVDDKAVQLEYGRTYEFRVRFADLTRGGPDVNVELPEPPGSSLTTIRFQRRKQPGRILIVKRPTADARQVTIAKPRLGYPEILFTGASTFADLEADLAAIAADPDPAKAREISLPDPDVLSVEIRVHVRTLDGDNVRTPDSDVERYLPLYTTTRMFEDDELTLDLDFQDHPVLANFSEDQPTDGPLTLPTARNIRLTFTAMGRDTPNHFATEEARHGAAVPLECRANATAENDLVADPTVFPSLRSFFLQRPAEDLAVPRPAERLAQEAALDHTGLILSGRAGRRTVMGCSASLRHTPSPDRSSIHVASGAELIQSWINVIQLQLLRDWTWDGMGESGITITRTIRRPALADVAEVAGTLRLPHAIGPKALDGLETDVRVEQRQWADLIFFDAFDPQRAPGEHPTEITVEYKLELTLRGPATPAIEPKSIRLPVTTPPCQVPRLVSAGIALSPYTFAEDYSSTEPRRRMLWLELAEPPEDPEDAYFIRVLANAPDPLLIATDETIRDVIEPPLAIDPEWMRLITPGQPSDENGLRAMQPVPDSLAGPVHYLIPLPEGLNEASLELFGFFVYEIRLGHTSSRWSTAQGRFGPALRVAGVQHPAPPLVCQAARGKTNILVRAPYATPVHEGRNMRPIEPKTEIWAQLYARARQADAAAWRNIPVTRMRLSRPRVDSDLEGAGARVLYGEGELSLDDIRMKLRYLGLPPDTPLTALAVELFGEPAEEDPLGDNLGYARMLRVSSLVPVPDEC